MRKLRVTDFDLRDTIECGQTFCWMSEGEGFVNADIGQAVYVEQRGNSLHWESTGENVPLSQLFRLKDPLLDIQREIQKDQFMKESIAFAPGLRIVSDPIFPCLVSFLCATWKNIPAIKTLVQRIRESCGPTYELRGKTFYGMPTPEQLNDVNVKDLKSLGLAWRAEFIKRSTEAIVSGDMDLEGLRSLPYEVAHAELKSLHGVGDKVADCVGLFSIGHLEAFPIDVWVEKVIQKQYGIFTKSGKSYQKKSIAAREYFGRYAGYAQEYLYYYSRSTFKS